MPTTSGSKPQPNFADIQAHLDEFPPLFKRQSLTKLSPFKGEKQHWTPSNSIGNNFSLSSQNLDIHHLKPIRSDGFLGDSKQPPQGRPLILPPLIKPSENATFEPQSPLTRKLKMVNKIQDEQMDEDSQRRYDLYLENEIPTDDLTVITDDVWLRIQDKVPRRLLKNKKLSEFRHKLRDEIRNVHSIGQKHGIMNYLLLDPSERQRLRISDVPVQPVPKLVSGPFPWSIKSLQKDLEITLFVSHPTIVQIQRLFEKYHGSKLIDAEFVSSVSYPVTSSHLVNLIKDKCKSFRHSRLAQWWEAILKILVETKKDWYQETDSDGEKLDKFFGTLSMLLSRQLTDLAVQCLKEYTRLLLKLSLSEDKFVLFPVVEEGKICLKETLGKVETDFTSSLSSIAQSLNKMPALETRIFRSLENQKIYINLMDISLEHKRCKETIGSEFQKYESQIQDFIKSFEIFSELFSNVIEEKMSNYLAKDDYEEVDKLIDSVQGLSSDLKSRPEMQMIGPFRLNCQELKRELNVAINRWLENISASLRIRNDEINQGIRTDFTQIEQRLNESFTESTEKVMKMVQFVDDFERVTLSEIQKRIFKMQDVLNMMVKTTFTLDSDFVSFGSTFSWPNRLAPRIKEIKDKVEEEKKQSEKAIDSKVKEIEERCANVLEQLEKVPSFGILIETSKNAAFLQSLATELDTLNQMIQHVNNEQKYLQLQTTTFDSYQKAMFTIEPYKKLWDLANDYFAVLEDRFMNNYLDTLEASAADESVQEMSKTLFTLNKTFVDQATPRKVVESLKAKVDKFKEYLPLISVLCNKGLKDRHWQSISDIVGVGVKPESKVSLSQLLTKGIMQYTQQLLKVNEQATREHAFELSLVKMKQLWDPMKFELVAYRDTGTFILAAVDEIQSLLDDQIVKVQSMRGSPFVKPIEEDLVDWEKRLMYIQDLIDIWLQVQATWLYLEPIFGSEDIVKQMPKEARLFKDVDNSWRLLMKTCKANSQVVQLSNDGGKQVKTLKTAYENLEQVQKGLNEYLEKKRLYFPRFFFLSNDELLEILSETKDPLRVQPHLKKCFEGISELQFKDGVFIQGMISSEREQVSFTEEIDTTQARGAVEKWLVQVEAAMKTSLQNHVARAVEEYKTVPRDKFVLAGWPGQIVLTTTQIYWTHEVEEAIRSTEDPKSLEKYRDLCTQQLESIATLVRGELSGMARATLSALCVIDVHARDLVASLAENKITSTFDFEWMSQLRYYWREKDVQVQMMNANITYGYEYLGNSPRLVITPLTDRCYRTVISALDMNLYAGPEGPAGTGKTETTKDLAKALAKQCVVFNCSDGLDYLAMGKFFKGLASAGAWACFDEFNRINLEVLSVVAQQVLTIQRGVAQKLSEFVFEGTKLRLNQGCAVFITMNPGYAGRSELPDNLKALFRPVAMMVPDYALIAEISLYSCGYVNARSLAKKIVATFRLCSEQLSSQDHYDYGMRAVKAVLIAAANLKIKYPQEDEQIILLRSINDTNLSKFLQQDIPLFRAITADLFPGVTLPVPNYEGFLAALESNLDKRNFNRSQKVIDKILQTFEMMRVRHGFMLVGEPDSGKSTCYQILQAALDECRIDKPMKYQIINPKSITMGQLYGQFDPVTHEWSDGVIANVFRNFTTTPEDHRKWVIFDGPVDAVWIENMNTVLDDNKKLCLTSGEIIQLTPSMSVVFEVRDLAVASPATVSRCGMIFFEPTNIGWNARLRAWLKNLTWAPANVRDQISAIVDGDLLQSLLDFMRSSKAKLFIPRSESELVVALANIMDCHLKDMLNDSPTINNDCLMPVICHSLCWSFGVSLLQSSRNDFEQLLKVKSAEANQKQTSHWPKQGSIFNQNFEYKTCQWVKWLDDSVPPAIPTDVPLDEVVIPTVDSIRYTRIIDMLISNGKNICVCGPSGTGKSVYITDYLLASISKNIIPIFVNFSAQTAANQTQDLILSKLDKRRKGVMGPPLGKRAVVFVDDLNMPLKEKYGAQPPIELIRQAIDVQFWYDLKDTSVINLTDVSFIAAMGPPGGGRQHVTTRALRHFHLLGVNEFDDQTMSQIFSTVLQTHFKRSNFSSEVTNSVSPIVSASLKIYRQVSSTLLPTPAKSHYIFNLRDIARVVRGLLLTRQLNARAQIAKVWTHEIYRVFNDRLCDEKDRLWFFDLLKETLKQDFNFTIRDIVADGSGDEFTQVKNIMYSCLSSKAGGSYDDTVDLDAANAFIKEKLEEYNALSKKPLDLVVFKYAIEHISRVIRVLKQQGHILLVGVGGSGRQSVAKVASFIMDYRVFQIELTRTYSSTEWKEDLKKITKYAGVEGKQCAFIFSDTQVKYESFLEDLNNLLNTGDVPNLFPSDEKIQIAEAMRQVLNASGQTKDASPLVLFNYFLQRCKRNLHVILCMSPVGESFRNRLRLYPSLVNCCTIDWFDAWPEEALEKVGHRYLSDIANCSADERLAITTLCKTFHSDVTQQGEKFYQNTRRKMYITPTFYLDLLKTFKDLLDVKRGELLAMKNRYQQGLVQLSNAASQVAVMQKELSDLKPVLIKTTAETDEMIKIVERETVEVDKKAVVVKADEEAANKKAAAAKAIRDECEADLSLALPALESAMSALDTLKPQDITLVKSMKNPPAAVKLVLEAICVMKDMKPARVKDQSGKMVDDYWPIGQKMLSDPKFLQSLKEYDKDNIQPKIIQVIRQRFVPNEDFRPEVVKNSSSAAEGLCRWVLAMETYEKVAKVVAPKKEALKAAEVELEGEMEKLRGKQMELKLVQDKVDALKRQLDEMNTKKVNLEQQIDLVGKKLQRAEKLISGLGGERDRWTDAVQYYQALERNVLGDILLSSAVITYFGPFTSQYRNELLQKWQALCQQLNIAVSQPFNFIKTMEDPVQTRNWIICGLPNDSFSKENALIATRSRRYPLFIDPQNQANRWLRNLEAQNQLTVIKLTSDDYLRHLENAIQFGKPVLLENIGEEIDSVLEPLLAKQFVKQNGNLFIQLGDALIECSKDFRLYITTKMRNPHYLPELAAKVTILNFMITPEGLQDQLLGIVAAKEKPELEELRNKLTIQSAENKRQLKEIEDKILEILSSSSNILEDETAVQILSSSKVLANDIAEKQKIADETEAEINATRMGYQPVSKHATILFFVVSALANIDSMYQNSLGWFINLYVQSIDTAEKSDNLQMRVDQLKKVFTLMLYRNVCQSIFKKDKLLFSFLLACNLAKDQQLITSDQWTLLMGGAVQLSGTKMPKAVTWLADDVWDALLNLQSIQELKKICLHIKENEKGWQELMDSKEPHLIDLPHADYKNISLFSRFLVIKTMRPDKVVPAASKFVLDFLGREFVEPPVFDLKNSFKDSKAHTPLMFILSPGADPTASLYTFAANQRVQLESISMGQGQGVLAEELIRKATANGSWVLLQNCHLATSWMTSLEKICEQLSSPNVHQNFRLWLTTYPSDIFPVSIIQNSIKLVNEPPNGLKANILRCYVSDVVKDDLFKRSPSKFDDRWKRFLFSLCFFHAVIQERKNFGPLGWNIPYEFNETDLSISAKQLHKFLTENEKVPLKALRYVTGECNYGGRCTDGMDRRLLVSLLEKYYTENLISEGAEFQFTQDGQFKMAPDGNYDSYVQFIQAMSTSQQPQIFGIHENGLIVRDLKETRQFVDSLLLTQSQFGSGGQSDNLAADLASSLLAQIPLEFDVDGVRKKFPVSYEESMNTVLTQEVIRFNKLLSTIRNSLQQTIRGLKGQIVLSPDLEKIANSLLFGKVPESWLSVSYPSLRPLSLYVANLIERCKFFSDWIENSTPAVFDISYFFFTQAFVTGVLQNYARLKRLPIDTLLCRVQVLTDQVPSQRPSEGAYIKGLQLEGARWDRETNLLQESFPKQLSDRMPIIHLIPMEISRKDDANVVMYKCPLYRTSARRGTLSTTGHSTNFVMMMDLPTDKDPAHWIHRGVALMLESNM